MPYIYMSMFLNLEYSYFQTEPVFKPDLYSAINTVSGLFNDI